MKTKTLLLSIAILIFAGFNVIFLNSKASKAELQTKSVVNNSKTTSNNNGKKNKSGTKALKSTNTQMNWLEMGPSNIGGRTRALLIDKDNSNLIFAGSVGGGIWKSTTGGLSWVKVDGGDLFDNLFVSSICQSANGDIYVGTGEYFGTYNRQGFQGQGIWKSINHGQTWTHLTSTWNDSDNSKQIFNYVNKLAAHPTNNNKIYAATYKGLMLSIDGGNTWNNTVSDTNADFTCTDVQISKDGLVVVASLNNKAYVCNTGNDVFINKSGTNQVLPLDTISIDVKRIEFAIAPSNSNYIYCLAADTTGALNNVYQSKDKGNTWTALLINMSSQFVPFGTAKSGVYNNSIAVYPDDYEHILIGGVNLFEWSPLNPWQQVSSNEWDFTSPIYVHSGIHTIVFADNYSTENPVIYAGTDGGVFRSLYGGYAWQQLNKNYNTTIYNSLAFSNTGKIIGGTYNNGTLMLSLNGTTEKDAISLYTGSNNGFNCEYSMLNPKLIFVTNSYGALGRSEDEGKNIETDPAELFSPYLTSHQTISDTTQPYQTPIRLWESFYDTNSTQYILSKIARPVVLGDTIYPESSCKRILPHILTVSDMNGQDTLQKGDTVYVKDTYQSILAMGFKNSVWITRQGLDMSKSPMSWYSISSLNTVKKAQNIEFSKNGDVLYFSDYNYLTDTSRIYRCANLTNGRDSLTGDYNSSQNVITTQEIGKFGHKITSIAVDPENANNIIVTLGGYGKSDYIYYSFNAATTTSMLTADNFMLKQGYLDSIPIYSSIILWNNSLQVILGTENGIYSTDNITASSPVWLEQNTGLAHVPVVQLRQQIHPNGWFAAPVFNGGFNSDITNHGVIYAATAGRGIFRCEDFKGPVNVPEISNNKVNDSKIIVFPNPAKDFANISFNVNKKTNVIINIYNINGSIVKSIKLNNQEPGNHTIGFVTNNLNKGIYFAKMETDETISTAKFIVY